MTRSEAWAKLEALQKQLEQRGDIVTAADIHQRFLRHFDPGHFTVESLEKAIQSYEETVSNLDWLRDAQAQYKRELPIRLLPSDVANRLKHYRPEAVTADTLTPVAIREALGKAARMLRVDPQNPNAAITDRRREKVETFSRAIVQAYHAQGEAPEYEDWASRDADGLYAQWMSYLYEVSPAVHEWVLSTPEGERFLLWAIHNINEAFKEAAYKAKFYTKAPETYDFNFTDTVGAFDIPKGESAIMGGHWRVVRISSQQSDKELEYRISRQKERNLSGGYGLLEEDPREFVKREHAKADQDRREEARLDAWRERAKGMTADELWQHREEIRGLRFFGRAGERLFEELHRDAKMRDEQREDNERIAAINAKVRHDLFGGDLEGNVLVEMATTGMQYERGSDGKPIISPYTGDPVKVAILSPIRVIGRVLQWPEGRYGTIKTTTGMFAEDVEYIKVRPDPFYPPETPVEVWKAGAPYRWVQKHRIQGEDLYGWPTESYYYGEWKVVTAAGRTVPKNSKKFQAFVEEAKQHKVDRK